MTNSLPMSGKTDQTVDSGYDSGDFADNYWTTPDVNGRARIDRDAGSLIRLTKNLVRNKIIPQTAMMLDIGAGPGNMVRDFREAGFNAMGCEFSMSGRALALKRFGIHLDFCDLRKTMPYVDGVFGFAYCVGVLSMIPKVMLPVTMLEMRRVMKVGGVLHINIMNPNSDKSEPHLTSLPYLQWWTLFTDAGFEDVTSLWPPQREGIGVVDEFCGLFRRRK